ncbi:Uncharacterised protein [uncultured archaeon]|nr:Uncharacterised protein [uncultured archaeon]
MTGKHFNMEVGDKIELRLESKGAKGDWFGRYYSCVVFLKTVKESDKLKAGNTVVCRITEMRQTCVFATLVDNDNDEAGELPEAILDEDEEQRAYQATALAAQKFPKRTQ